MSYLKDRHERLVRQAHEAFEKHLIRKRSEGRWLLQKRYSDDKGWDWAMATEIISLAGGQLYVGGDIDFVIFAYYSDSHDHESKVRWMGRHTDIGYYVTQKAHIGTGRQLIDVYDEQAAEQYVREWLQDELEDDDRRQSVVEGLRVMLNERDYRFEEYHMLVDALHDAVGHDAMSERYDIGTVTSSRVYYAHAALRRLCDLFDGQEETFG